jgi:cell division septum initiation protein DivIVA
MQKLIFESLSLLSRSERAARHVSFDAKINSVVGSNDTGKSTLLKSLYHALGAKPAKLPSNWKTTDEIVALRFSIDAHSYEIVRYNDFFGVFDSKGKLQGAYDGITRDGGIGPRLGELLGSSIRIQDRNGNWIVPSPSHYFLPYYIDQDAGWSSVWESFGGLQQITDFKRTMVDYHIGLRPKRYYELVQELATQKHQIEKTQNELDALHELKRQIDSSIPLMVSLDPDQYRKELEALLAESEKLRAEEDAFRQQLSGLENERLFLQQQVQVAENVGQELHGDYGYLRKQAEKNHSVDCPTCGAHYENALSERFSILDDYERCGQIVLSLRGKIANLNREIEGARVDYEARTRGLSDLNRRLSTTTEGIRLADFLRSQGVREARRLFDDNAVKHKTNIDKSNERLKELEEERTRLTDKKRSAEILSAYRARFAAYLEKLDVKTISREYFDKPYSNMPTSGSDLPRAVLAQFYSILHTMEKFSSTYVACPIVVDSPVQQDPDDANIKRIMNFVVDERPTSNQLIIGTVSMHGIKFNGNTIELDTKHRLLQKDAYKSVNDHVSPLLEAMFKELAP